MTVGRNASLEGRRMASMARDLDLNPRTIERYVAGRRPVPAFVFAALRELLKARKVAAAKAEKGLEQMREARKGAR